jgi:hydroxymethylpyrimidine/phosphomethylpyrimidine kinase
MTELQAIPAVLSLSGHDPTGGAGIQADIEAIAGQGCHACSIITALTVQDTRNVKKVMPQPPMEIAEQFDILMQDMAVDVIKIGLIGTADCAIALAEMLRNHPTIPVVLDPVLSAGGGKPLADAALIEAIRERLMPHTTVLTPNSEEARRLAPDIETLDQCGLFLLSQGCRYVLITGTHEPGPTVCNRLFADHRRIETFSWDRLPHSYHGSGCTLASTIAAGLARGQPPIQAIRKAQEYTWNALNTGFRPGKGQYLPNRFPRREKKRAAPLS